MPVKNSNGDADVVEVTFEYKDGDEEMFIVPYTGVNPVLHTGGFFGFTELCGGTALIADDTVRLMHISPIRNSTGEDYL